MVADSITLEPAREALRATFGFDDFRGRQAEVVERVLQGRSTLAVMPTGAGKSLTYQLPATLLPGTCVVISPLIALMHDQLRSARANGIRAATLTSADADWRETQDAYRAGELDLLYVAPERASQPAFRDFLSSAPIALFAVDEAHCVSEWGHDFRPDYRMLRPLMDAFPDVPRLALTATADRQTRADVLNQLGIPEDGLILAGFDRPNIRYAIRPRDNAVRQIAALMAERPGPGIVYAPDAPQGGRSGREAGRHDRARGLALSRGTPVRGTRCQPGRFRCERGHGDCRHHRVRHGDRQARRALRRACLGAQVDRGVLPGDRPCGPRWRSCGGHDVLVGRRLCHGTRTPLRTRSCTPAGGTSAARRAGGPCGNRWMSPRGAAPTFWRRPARDLRQLRQLPRPAASCRHDRACAQAAVRRVPHRTELRHGPSAKGVDGRGGRARAPARARPPERVRHCRGRGCPPAPAAGPRASGTWRSGADRAWRAGIGRQTPRIS